MSAMNAGRGLGAIRIEGREKEGEGGKKKSFLQVCKRGEGRIKKGIRGESGTRKETIGGTHTSRERMETCCKENSRNARGAGRIQRVKSTCKT